MERQVYAQDERGVWRHMYIDLGKGAVEKLRGAPVAHPSSLRPGSNMGRKVSGGSAN